MIGNVRIMGIVNLNSDSFFSGSRTEGADAVAHIRQMWADGADVVDLGACSTRPGSTQPDVEEEWRRLEPVLSEISRSTLRGNSGRFAPSGPSHCLARPQSERPASGPLPLPSCGGAQAPRRVLPEISVDTFRAEIVRRTYETIGPFLVNDISAGEMDPKMLETVGQLGLPYVAMHMRGTPETMQSLTDYDDVVAEVIRYFKEFDKKAADAGIREWILDPGFGFAKTIAQNYELLNRLKEVSEAFPQEVLVGLSRKSMIYKVLGITPEEAMPATQVLNLAALQSGATWLRVHDVVPAVQTAKLYSTIYTSSPGAAK
ncbi:MAG: dihydropteroate synthase [Bacteroidales bacterium]|nr:dihydropteroate synthase [Bacteroidales bacterium]